MSKIQRTICVFATLVIMFNGANYFLYKSKIKEEFWDRSSTTIAQKNDHFSIITQRKKTLLLELKKLSSTSRLLDQFQLYYDIGFFSFILKEYDEAIQQYQNAYDL